MSITKAAPRPCEAARVEHDDLSFAQISDCFTFIVLRQVEEMGSAVAGESPAFVRERGTGLDGDLRN